MASDKMSVFLDELNELMKKHEVEGAGFFMGVPGGESGDVSKVGEINDARQLFHYQFGFSMLKAQMWKKLEDMDTDTRKPYARVPYDKIKDGVINLNDMTEIELDVWAKLLRDARWEGEIKYD